MKKFFHKIKTGLLNLNQNLMERTLKRRENSKFYQARMRRKNDPKRIARAEFMDRHSLLFHIPLSLAMCFILEWLSHHSFMSAVSFVQNHTVAYLYNSYLIFVCYTLCFLVTRQSFVRYIVSAVFVMLGITNCIVLLNRVTPFGFTDLYMIGDLLTMQNTNYFSRSQGAVCVIAIVIYALYMVRKWFKGKKSKLRTPLWFRVLLICASFGSIPLVTNTLQDMGYLSSYFGNLAQGYTDYGYVYGFATSVFNRGMSKPDGYSEELVDEIVAESTSNEETTLNATDGPNIVVVLLESFFDVSECSFIETSEDPIPYFHYLEENYSTGHLTVPVVGAGTCNSEFEILTGMSCQFFGPGEYPQKTILKETDCESIAADLRTVGYSSHVVHNNGGNFYSRANAFSMMGFDSFTCKEMLDITEYTPMGSWPTDTILIGATSDALDTTEGSDFVYTITVGTHGDYPTEKIIEDPAITVTAVGKDEALENQWEYYINMLHDMDTFIQEYIAMFEERDEDTLVIMFGDHLPTMGLTADEVATGDLYQTKYITWNNFGMNKEDADLTAYQLVSEYLGRLGFYDGTMVSYNQSKTAQGIDATSDEYMDDLEVLQYDILYGDRYVYDGEDAYPATDLEMGVKDVVIDSVYKFNGRIHIYGENFSKWSKVYINGEKVSTTYESGQVLTIDSDLVENGDIIEVCQVGSSSTIFRTSNAYTYTDPTLTEEELEALGEETEAEETEATNEANE